MPKREEYEPELVVKEGQQPYYLSDDGHGTMIAWEKCHGYSGGCSKPLLDCVCKGGPVEPAYITRWRTEARGEVFVALKKAATSIGTSVRSALKRSKPEPTTKSMADFVDQSVIDRVKAEKESRDQGQ